jgi:hypothetical protein
LDRRLVGPRAVLDAVVRNNMKQMKHRAGTGIEMNVNAEAGKFSLHHRVQNGSGAHQPPIQWVREALSLRVKRPGREADHSPPSSAEVKECEELYLHPQYAFMAWSVKKITETITYFRPPDRSSWVQILHDAWTVRFIVLFYVRCLALD